MKSILCVVPFHCLLLLPLLTLILHNEAVAGQCTVNMPTRDDLDNLFQLQGGANGQMKKKKKLTEDPLHTKEKQQSLFVSQTINCTGNLTQWTFAAKWYGSKDKFPELQVWRKQDETHYIKIAHSSLNSILTRSSNNLYTYEPNPPLQVQPGDVLGIHEPEKMKASFSIYLFSSSVVQNNYFYRERINDPVTEFDIGAMEVKDNQHFFPLVTPVIVTQPLPVSTSSTAVPVMTSTTTVIPHTSIVIVRSSTHIPQTIDTVHPQSTHIPDVTSTTFVPVSSSSPSTHDITSTLIHVPSSKIPHITSQHTSSTLAMIHSSSTANESEGISLQVLLIGILTGVTISMIAITASAMAIVALVLKKRQKEVGHLHIPKPTNGIKRNRYIEKSVASPLYEGTSLKLTQSASLRNQLPPIAEQAISTATTLPSELLDNNMHNEAMITTVITDSSDSISVHPSVKITTSTSSYDTLYRAEGTLQNNNIHDNIKAPISPYEKPVFSDTISEYDAEDICVPNEQQRKEYIEQNNEQEPDDKLYKALYEAQHINYFSIGDYNTSRDRFFEEAPTYWKPQCTVNAIYTQLASKRYREIPRQTIHVVEHLGSGQFATVNKAMWKTSGGEVLVAVKMLKKEASKEEKIKFLQEAAINGQFHHLNIVKLLGVVTVGEPAMIVLELLGNGNLKKFLVSHRPQNGSAAPENYPFMFLNFCKQIASGMEYLSKKTFVHRDLAARNILVSEQFICKVADFGMSRDLEENAYYVSQGGLVPIKWTAPEALYYRKYSTATDIWSYGVVMYEIWSTGRKPFSSLTNEEYIEQVDQGYRLPPPPGCPRLMYELMINCWHPKPSLRPSFTDILQHLKQPKSLLLEYDVNEADISLSPECITLGASLKCGHHLFLDLQRKYIKE